MIRRDAFHCSACRGKFIKHIVAVRQHGKVRVVNLSSHGFKCCPRCGKKFPDFVLVNIKMIDPGGLVVWDESGVPNHDAEYAVPN